MKTGEVLEADFIVAGIGVRPALTLAEQAGLDLDRGVKVDAYLRNQRPGDFRRRRYRPLARPAHRRDIRVEHWVVAERQGQTAARNMLGQRERFDCVPFFWTEQYDFSLAYVGHAEGWDNAKIDGRLDADDCTVTYRRGDGALAVAVVHRDLEGFAPNLRSRRRWPRPDDDRPARRSVKRLRWIGGWLWQTMKTPPGCAAAVPPGTINH